MHETIRTPEVPARASFTDAEGAVAHLKALYDQSTAFLAKAFADCIAGTRPQGRVRAFYPEVRMTTTSSSRVSTGRPSMLDTRSPARRPALRAAPSASTLSSSTPPAVSRSCAPTTG